MHDPTLWTWPALADVRARLGVPAVDPADDTDLQQALDTAVAIVVDHSTVFHRWAASATSPDTVPPRVWRGTVDMAVWLYERRGSRAVGDDGLPVGMSLHAYQLLGMRRYAYPSIGG